MRFWSYEDSTAYTPNIKYKFFTIVDDDSSTGKLSIMEEGLFSGVILLVARN